MKILIVSDSHRYHENLRLILEKEKPIDMLLHCGDAEGEEYDIGMMAGCPMQIVTGNNDFFTRLPKELELVICGRKIMMTHGHYYYVSMGPERIVDEAKSRGMDVVLFGHTHKPMVEEIDGIMVVNPGSVSYPRQSGRRPSYVVWDLGNDGSMHFEIRYL